MKDKYGDRSLNDRFGPQKAGNPFDFPETPDDLELMVAWFFDRLRVIVSVENHVLKFDGVKQIIDILDIAGLAEKIDVNFAWVDGQWFITSYGTPDDILHLPRLLKRFSRIYRFNAKDYSYGDEQELHFLPSGESGHLNTKDAFESVRRRKEGR